MDKKEIVYFGDPNSVYNINLMKEITKRGYKVSCFNVTKEVNKLYKNGNEIKNSFLRKIKKYKLCKFFFKQFNKSSIAHIQFVSFENLFYLPFYIKKFRYYVLSFWGSDLLRQSKTKLLLLTPLFICSKKITFETEEMKSIFISKLPLFKRSKKLCYARFGLSELDEIDNATENDIKTFSNKYLIDTNRNIVVLGYNRRKEQQHLAVIESFSDLMIEKIQLIIPWSYGEEDSEYKSQIISKLDSKNIKYVFINDFLSDKEVACLRLITDFFVQVQTTDSLSACMLESLYAKKTVITGNWLPYKFLDEKGIIMKKVDSPKEVSAVLHTLLEGKNINENRNSEIIASFSKWEHCIHDWLCLYNCSGV